MAKLKMTSKRMPASKRYKIERKVREHRRKMKKEAKKTTSKRTKLRKDPGIPNLYPYKEQLLKEFQDRKEDSRQMQQKERLEKQRSLQSLKDHVAKKTEEYDMKDLTRSIPRQQSELRSDSSLRAFYREFRKVVEAADVVLEVLDARDPLGCRCYEMEQTVLASGSNKKLVLLLNKIDLVPQDNVLKWLKYLRNELPTLAFKANTQTQKHHLSCRSLALHSGSHHHENSSVCLGSEMLMKLLGNYCSKSRVQTSIAVGVVGLPNVGKSSIINSLKRDRVCNIGSTPGITRSMQEVQLDKHIKLLDCPGIIMIDGPSDDPSIALRNCIKVESLSDPITPVEAILRRFNCNNLMLHYTIPEYSGVEEFLILVAKRLGKLKKGGIPDINAAARKVLHDWNSGQINYYTNPPEGQTLPAHISAEIVHEWSKTFDIAGLHEEEDKILEGLTEKMETALVLS